MNKLKLETYKKDIYIRPQKGIKWFRNGEDIVILHSGKMIKLNSTASKIWRLCVEDKFSLEESIRLFRVYYNHNKKEIEKDLKKFISGLITIGTVKIYEHKRKQNLSSSMPEQGKAKSGRDSFRETTFYPRSVNWEITHRCNLKCIHCLIPLKERGVKKDVELTAEQIKEILYELQNLGTYEILFTGGEPFIRRDFTEIVAFASSMGFRLSINTNATLITDEIINVLKELNIYHLTVSVYGDEETHDKITGVKGSYKLMDENVRKMADCGMNVQLHFIP